MMSALALTGITLAIYLIAAICYGAGLFLRASASPAVAGGTTTHQISHFGRPLVWAGILAQFAALGVWCVTTHRSPFASEFGTLSVLAWGIAIGFALVDWRVKLPAVGALALVAACLTLFWGILQNRAPLVESPLLKGQIVSLHVLAALFSFGLLVIAAICAGLYLLQNRLLRQHNVGGLFRKLPPLETLDRTAYQCVAFALPMLTLSIALGLMRVFGGGLAAAPRQWFTDPHLVASFVVWLVYAFYLGSRLAAGWRGVRVQYILLVGLLAIAAIYLVPTTTHRFG